MPGRIGPLTSERAISRKPMKWSWKLSEISLERDVQIVGPHDMLDAVLGRLDARPSSTAPVVQDGRLVGLLTADVVAEFLSIQAALDHAPA
jgi:hypothetical protein